MSDVLRKKIKTATGVPPSVLHLHAFWDDLRTVVGDWASEALDAPFKAEILSKMVISGEQAREDLTSDVSFPFQLPASEGAGAIIFGQTFVSRYSARRLGEDPEDLKSASDLLLRLVCERSAATLWQQLLENVLSYQVPKDGGTGQASSAGLSESGRYLLIILAIKSDDEDISVRIVIDIDAVTKNARAQKNDRSGSEATRQSPAPDALRESIFTSQIEIDAILNSFSLTVGECSRLSVGQVVPLATAELNELSLCTETVDGMTNITSAELGVWKNQRAVKLRTAIPAEFARELGASQEQLAGPQQMGDMS